jgi:hypothetical protein
VHGCSQARELVRVRRGKRRGTEAVRIAVARDDALPPTVEPVRRADHGTRGTSTRNNRPSRRMPRNVERCVDRPASHASHSG